MKKIKTLECYVDIWPGMYPNNIYVTLLQGQDFEPRYGEAPESADAKRYWFKVDIPWNETSEVKDIRVEEAE